MNALPEYSLSTRNVVHCMDALSLLRGLPSNYVNCIVTSPPYNMGEGKHGWTTSKASNWYNMKLRSGYTDFDDDMPHGEYVDWQRKCVSQMLRVIRADGAIFYIHKYRILDKKLYKPDDDILRGFPIRQVVIWDRGSGHNHNPAFFTPSYEVVYVLAGDRWQKTKQVTHLFDIWRIKPDMNNGHPAPFPVELAERCIMSTVGDLILDPFAGSGTTAVAAQKLGRDYIGCDISREYVELARTRLALPYTPPLFAELGS